LLALVASARADQARLVILHTTDLHGSLAAWDDLADRPAARGLVKLSTMGVAARREGAPTLLLDAGDCIEGSPLEAVYHAGDRAAPDPMIAAMNLMGYEAMAIGNHEFSYGLA